MCTAVKRETLAVANAYMVIWEFFGAFSLHISLALLKKIIKTAAAPHYWKNNPSNAVYFLEKLRELLNAAFTIACEEAEREAAIVTIRGNDAPDITSFPHYCGWHYKSNPWYFFPRHLSVKEYANPYMVFYRLAKRRSKKGWKLLIKELSFYTLGNACIDEWLEDEDALTLYLVFAKLIEAAHLVALRAVPEVEGKPAPGWRGWQPPPVDQLDQPSTNTL